MKTIEMNKLAISCLLAIMSLPISAQTHDGEATAQLPQKVDYTYLSDNFKSPGSLYGTDCWWWWLNGHVSKEAITKELEAMKARHFFGAMVFDAGGHNQRGNKDIPAGPQFGSKEWNDLFVFALDEAKRLGLEIGFNIMSGWNLGGPCITPEYAAKQLVYTETRVSGKKKLKALLEKPQSNMGFYKDVAVLAFPLRSQNVTDTCITFLKQKLAVEEMGGSAPDCRFLLNNDLPDKNVAGKTTYIVNVKDVVNITDKFNSDGTLVWSVPKGDWCIMRIGYTCTNASVSTSSGSWQGNVIDYMSKRAFDYYWNTVVEPIFQAAGNHVGNTLKYMETDSWECGGMNWTDNFAQEFKDFCGYDILNYLPVLGGYVMNDINTSNAFLADFRKVIANAVATNNYARFAEHAHEHNMGIQPESAGPHAGPLDGIKNYGYNDIVMSEFWSPSPHRPLPPNRFFLKQASSAAHIYGKRIVGAESFTTIGPHWNDELWHNQKSAFDHEICSGLNRVYFHTFTSSPSSMGLPGQEYFAGTHINPRVTWWNESGPFIDYLRRTQFIVQNGQFVGDVLYYYGDHIPNVFPYKHSDPAGAMPGFDYDVTDENILLSLKVEDGMIVVPSGIKYRVLVLPNHRTLSFAVLKKIDELLQQGAQVIGYKPLYMVTLIGGEDAQREFHQIADKIWGDGKESKGEREYAKGSVAWGVTARDYLMSKGLKPDFVIEHNDSHTDFDYIHYVAGGKQFYFISNQTDSTQDFLCSFRTTGFQPEFWDAVTGDKQQAAAFVQHHGQTTLPLSFNPYGSLIVCFNSPISETTQGTSSYNYPVYDEFMTVDGSWTVHFDTKWGGPETVEFPSLTDWSANVDEGIKYYSGAAVYVKTFKPDFAVEKGERYFLSLGSVKDVGIATVKINGVDKGILWTPPFMTDISNELKSGTNTIEIKVVNSWFNRVAGDELNPDKKQFTSTNIVLWNDFLGHRQQTIKLQPSGLLGPVTILHQRYLPSIGVF
jgi:hypothetical protein